MFAVALRLGKRGGGGVLDGGGGGKGRVWDPQLCAPKKARQDFPCCKISFFPTTVTLVCKEGGGGPPPLVYGHSNTSPGTGRGRGGGVNPTYGELSAGARGPLGRLPLCNTANNQEPLHCNHSKAHDFKKEWEGDTMQIAV